VPHRFFAPDLTSASAEVTLPPGESQHLARVLRLREGDAIEVFDGRGTLRAATVTRAHATSSVVTPGDARDAAPEAPAPLIVIQGLLKGDAMDAVIRDATVLGATGVWPVVTSRTNVPARAADAVMDRWHRVAIAAAKQCGRAVLPHLASVTTIEDVLREPPAATSVKLWLTEPPAGGEPAEEPILPVATCLAIGPEGGWAAGEMEAARAAGWQPWTIAPVTLRAEHVALAALSVVRHAWYVAARRRIT